MGGYFFLHVLLDVLDEGIVCLAIVGAGEYDERLDDVPALGVGFRYDGGLGDGGVLAECTLYVKGADSIAGGKNDVVGAPLEPEVIILVEVAEVTREVPLAVRAVDEASLGLLGLFPVACEKQG